MKKLKLDLEVVLPGVPNADDECVRKMQSHLGSVRGIIETHIDQDESKNKSVVCVHYDSSLVNLAKLQRLIERSGAGITKRYQHEIIHVFGMDCSDCTVAIEHALQRTKGVMNASANYASGTLSIEYDTKDVSRSVILERLKSLGYQVSKSRVSAFIEEKRELIFSLLSGALLFLGWGLGFAKPEWAIYFYLISYAFGGWDIGRHALSSLRQMQFDTDLLMIAAAIGAAFLGDYFEGALLLFLFSLGHSLEEMALDKARDAVSKLGRLSPKTALVKREQKELELKVEDILLRDIVVLRPGVRIPVDGVVVIGSSSVDQSSITGESIPVEKSAGDKVFAGTVNGEGALEVEVARLAKDNTLSRVMQMVEEAQNQKTNTQQLTERFNSYFVPAVFIGDFLFVIIQLSYGASFSVAFLKAMTVLVSASPCALALGAPSAILSAIACAAKNGVLIKGGVHLETLGKVDVIAFDKTGTLTIGHPQVTDIVDSQGNNGEIDNLLAMAAAMENRSGHPLAQAIVQAAKEKMLSLPATEEVQSITGKGLRAKVAGELILIGSPKFISDSGVKISPTLEEKLKTFEESGKTVILLSNEKIVLGAIALADTARPNAKESISKLKSLGVRQTMLLTGDNKRLGAAVSHSLGIDDYRAELLPEDKVNELKAMSENLTIAMVGDGVNDAPALAAASVGVAMGGAATDVALDVADVALMGDDLSKLPFVIGLGRKTRQVILQNLLVASGVIFLLVLGSLFSMASITTAILFHEGSTLIVVLNSLRLLGYKSN